MGGTLQEHGYHGIEDKWNFPDGQGRRKEFQSEEVTCNATEINSRASK